MLENDVGYRYGVDELEDGTRTTSTKMPGLFVSDLPRLRMHTQV